MTTAYTTNIPVSYRTYKRDAGAEAARKRLCKTYDRCGSQRKTARLWQCDHRTVGLALKKRANGDLSDNGHHSAVCAAGTSSGLGAQFQAGQLPISRAPPGYSKRVVLKTRR